MALPTSLATKRDQHRLHPFLHNIVVQTAIEQAANDQVMHNVRVLSEHFLVYMTCLLEKKAIVIPIKGVLHDAIYDPTPKKYRLQIIDRPWNETNIIVYSGFADVSQAFHRSMFATHSELAVRWVKENYGTDYHAWPPVANFCRVVRNAFVHGGKINIKSQDAPTVSWEGISYDHTSFGRLVLGDDLTRRSSSAIIRA